MIRFEGVTKRFGDFTAIENLNLEIDQGEFFALLGPSGCGKTTIMRMLAGFETPSEGRILINGQDISNIPPHERPVNMMFQSYALFPHLTVEKNIAFGLKQEGLPQREIRERVDEMLALVQLERFAGRKPHQLSGGQKQRVALARSLAKRPQLLLLDEPLGALDKKLREKTQFELVNIQEKLNMTFLIVTHDQEEAMTVSSRIAVMNEGKIEQVGPPAEVYEYPLNRYVADFIGDVNMLEGKVSGYTEQGLVLQVSDSCPDIRIQTAQRPPLGSTGWISIRPEKVAISLDQTAEQGNAVQGEVFDIAYTGNISTYHVRLADGSMIKAQTANYRKRANHEITWESRVWLQWRETAGVFLAE